MAPILTSATGFSPPVLDAPGLRKLVDDLKDLSVDKIEKDVSKLTELLEPWTDEHVFEEQVDLHEWIHPLNLVDASFQHFLLQYSKSLLLVEPIQDPKRMNRRGYFPLTVLPEGISNVKAASTLEDIQALPTEILCQLSVLLKFTEALLRNATGKAVYQSVHYLTDLLGAADDEIADAALSALQALSLPPALHKQQAPDQQVHTTLLHQMPMEHSRIVAAARGWGTRAMGLGLATTVTADDSIHGQGSLPTAAGELHFCYYQTGKEKLEDDSALAHIVLTASEMMADEDSNNMFVDDSSGDEAASNKRRKVSVKTAKPTAELFFLALKKTENRESIPADRLYSLLADIRLARSFHTRSSRIEAVERRLRALIAMLHSHPSQEVMTGYFQAQPELCVEIVDLVRPTVSSANVTASGTSANGKLHQDSISGLVATTTNTIPFSVRMLAVEALAALVLRRDGLTGALSGSARLSSVLIELGVGKGQYLGILPTLIRYSLASLNVAAAPAGKAVLSDDSETGISDSMEVGLAFVEATKPKPLPRRVQVEQALQFIDNVLTLTSAVVATPTGTAALVDCGLIPALLTTVSGDTEEVLKRLLPEGCQPPDMRRFRTLLRFISSQAVQILEGAFVTHSNALSAFHDLQGVAILMNCLSREIDATKMKAVTDEDGDAVMTDTGDADVRISSCQRIILFSIITCLTVVFHQESTSSTTAVTTSGGTQLRKPALTRALMVILDNVESFGGHLASLVATMLSDILNSDPHVVHYAHKSGIADSFLNMVMGKKFVDSAGRDSVQPIIPPVPELIMAIPNVISALALTEDGAKAVKKVNPFPALLRIFYHENYAMPRSRCLLNEMTAIVGTGLDEVMRHVDRLRPQILSAIAEAMNQVVEYAEQLTNAEEDPRDGQVEETETMRTCLIQYVMNFSQLLEQILHNEDHCEPFVEAGGLDALLKIFPSSMPYGVQFLAHLSGMSSPSVGTLHHSTLEESLSVAMKCLYMKYDTVKLIRKVMEVATRYLDAFQDSKQKLLDSCDGAVIDHFPLEPFLRGKKLKSTETMKKLASYLRHASHVQWITNIVATAIKAAAQRDQDTGSGWSRAEKEWRKELSSESFTTLIDRLADFHRSSIYDVCRVRTEEWFDKLERERLVSRSRNVVYRLRIVCPEGAVVRDGIEIDSCANVGSLDMGEVVEAFDRCINSSGILRYRTKRGWVSEMTRGHGREPISEVLDLWEVDGDKNPENSHSENVKDRRIEAGVPDLRSIAVGVLARGQAGYSELFASLSRLVTQGIRSMQLRTMSFENGTQGAHVASILSLVSTNIREGLNHRDISDVVHVGENDNGGGKQDISHAGTAMYLGCFLNLIYLCLFEDKRERRVVNFPLFVRLVAARQLDPLAESASVDLIDALRYVVKHGLGDFAHYANLSYDSKGKSKPRQRVSRSVAASYPPLVTLLRKILSSPMSSSPAASIMNRMKWKDVGRLLSSDIFGKAKVALGAEDEFFRPELFVHRTQLSISEIVKEAWLDPRMTYAPPFLVHPIATLVGEILVCLEDASKKKQTAESRTPGTSEGLSLSDLMRRRADPAANEPEEENFEASEDAIARLMEMGFAREHAVDAIESTRSNHIELAMEYALSHPPPSPATIERRRVQREERAARRNREETETTQESDPQPANAEADNPTQGSSPDTMDTDPVDTETNEGQPKEEKELSAAKVALSSWMEDVPSIACNLLASGESLVNESEKHETSGQALTRSYGDAEGEAMATVLSSFLLDVCHRYPEKRSRIVRTLIESLEGKLTTVGQNQGSYTVPADNEKGVASLCHAMLLFTRALPRIRLILLEYNLVTALVSCVDSCLQTEPLLLPLWITPVLLLLDIMAQPIVAFSEDGQDQPEIGGKEDGDLQKVHEEHMSQVDALTKAANEVFSVIGSGNDGSSSRKPVVSTLPAYFPLLPSESSMKCLSICQKLIVVLPQKGRKPSPGLAHAALLLLLRLLRSPKISSQCLRMDMAEAILRLPRESRFTGNAGLVTLILRRFLEDDATLQAAMETEIRSTVVKLAKKNGTPQSGDSSVPVSPFLEAVTPLLCREPGSFLKALAHCVQIDRKKSRSNDAGSTATVTLLSSKDRAARLLSLPDLLKTPVLEDLATTKSDGRRNTESSRHKKSASTGKGKSTPKSSKKGPSSRRIKDKIDTQKSGHSPADTPATHITCLLVNNIITLSSTEPNLEGNDQINAFLWVASLLHILADLVLAVPACASAVHNYRPHRGKDKLKKDVPVKFAHALEGCPAPPKTFISFIIHSLLPKDRWSIRMDREIWDRRKDEKDESSALKERKALAYRIVKVSQTAARVLAALVARPGEGRKRVIADLAFALSGGRLGHIFSHTGRAHCTPSDCTSRELSALQAWGELCLGFAAPRSNGRNLEGTTALSIETLKIMLDSGMAHALLYAINRVNLFHPMASNTCSVLLHPLEVLSRASVTAAIKDLVKKESKTNEEQTDDVREEASKPSTEMTSEALDRDLHRTGDEDLDMAATDEGRLGDGSDDAEMDDAEADNPSDDEGRSIDSRESSGSDESDESNMDDDEELSDMEETDSDESQAVDEEGDWDVDYDEGSVPGDQGQYEYEEEDEEEEGTDRIEQDVDEGWTRIEQSGFGGMLLGSRRQAPIAGAGFGDNGGRSRGVIDAAQAMIGSLLREAELSSETLAEIEGSLGIRIMSGGRSLRVALSSNDGNRGSGGDPLAIRVMAGDTQAGTNDRRGEVIGTLPHIHQRSRPDVGYSAFGRGGQWGDANSMEFVYGGPSVTSGNRNYDLVTDQEDLDDVGLIPSFTQLDLQLFPGGPASAASARTQHSLHPLLCGVDLPPMNSLVSDLLSHGQRSSRRGLMATRRPGDWTNATFSPGGFLVSTSNGNIIRSNRSSLGAPLLGGFRPRNVSGPIGWTDDGLPVDATVQEFSSAFERALAAEHVEAETETADNDEGTTEMITETEQDDRGATAAVPDNNGTAASPEAPTENPTEEQESTRNDGDRVASSLAAGLRLSSGDDSTITGERTEPAEPANQEAPAHDGNDNTELADAGEEPPNDGGDTADENNAAASSVEEAGNNEDANGTELVPVQDEHQDESHETNNDALSCPPGVDEEVFNSLPIEMQRDCVAQYQATQELEAQLDGSTLDPEVLAALPEDMRREIIEQDRRERMRQQSQEEPPADPSHAEEMDNASFLVSLAPDLREEILLTADDAFLNSLPPSIVAEAQILRERASSQNRRLFNEGAPRAPGADDTVAGNDGQHAQAARGAIEAASAARRRQRSGKVRAEIDTEDIVYLPNGLSPPVCKTDVRALLRLQFLLSPVRPSRILQKVYQNLCVDPRLRFVLASAFVALLHEDRVAVRDAVDFLEKNYGDSDEWRRLMDSFFQDPSEFPPAVLLGAAPDVLDAESFNLSASASLLRQRYRVGNAASLTTTFPSVSHSDTALPPVVASRILDTLVQMCKNSSRFSLHIMVSPIQDGGGKEQGTTAFEKCIGLLGKAMYAKSSANLDQLLSLLEYAVSPLSHISKLPQEEVEISQRDVDAAAQVGKEWVTVPRIEVSQPCLQLLCSILRMETCRDTAFTKVNTIVRRLCRVESNRGYVLSELASVAHGLGADALRDIKSLSVRLDASVAQHQLQMDQRESDEPSEEGITRGTVGSVASSITLSTSTSEVKLLRVLQTLQALCNDTGDDGGSKKNEGNVLVTEELVHLLRQMEFDDLWDELSSCLKMVQVIEGVKSFEDEEEDEANDDRESNDDGSGEEQGKKAKKLRNSAAGILTRFLPSVEAFFVANASATRSIEVGSDPAAVGRQEIKLDDLVGGPRVIDFVAKNKVLLNALVRNNAGLLDKGFRALVQVPRCRVFLDFDVKRQWFKTQVRRLRQQASRRHGHHSLRLHIRRKYVFEDAYHQLRLRNAEEMRGRLHITFRNEEGVDAGGLSREFFGILAKEIFNPNYALFTSTEDGCTFQPNPNSSINPDHLSYFRFVGRIVGKSVVDGFLLDAHFTRSLYKHMLGMEPNHSDMEAIDPDYYRNLKTILEYNLEDIGLDLTFSIDDHSFGRSQVIDLIPNGRKTPVTDANKEEYVRLVCQHRMTNAIQKQIKAYLDGFYELVSPELIAIFTPRELELLISGMPDIDVHDLKKNTDYVGWKATDTQIQWFWNIMFSLSRDEKASFLQFVTGSSKVPLNGFAELQGMRGIQKFSIHKTNGSKGALMSAHTCFNSLDLPIYKSEDEMKEKFLYTMNEGGGAFLFA